MTKREFMDRCEWEGGGLSAGFEYGIGASYLDDGDPEFKAMVAEAEKHWKEFDKVQTAIGDKFGDFDDQNPEDE